MRYFLALFFAATTALSAELKIGVGQSKITPPNGIGLAGYYHERGSEGVLDDIFAKATVLDDGSTRVAIVVCDLISMPRWIVVEARLLIEKKTGIPGANVMIAATHTHTAPVLIRETISDLISGGSKPIAQEYSRSLPKLIAESVAAANNNRKPVRISVAKEYETKLGYNRRFWMRDGSVGWNPGRHNPQVIRPAGPIDPEVGLLYAETLGANPSPILSFVNYAMHPDTTSGAKIPADYPGALARIMSPYKGPDMMTIFANGACGNINHIDVHWREQKGGTNEANRLGSILAASVFKAFPQLQSITNTGSLRVQHELLKLPLATFTEEELAQARKDIAESKTTTESVS